MIEEERLSSGAAKPEDESLEVAIRPLCLDDYIGQEKVKEQLRIFITAAKQRQESLDHLLVFGPPGLGKTTIANIVANEMGVALRSTSGPVLDKPGDLAALLTNLNAGDVLFIDEIHRLNPQVEEILYPAMEDKQLDIIIGEGPAARSIKIDLQNFTLIGATTRAGLLTSPLRDRFGIVNRLEYYDNLELQQIVLRAAKIFGLKIVEEAALEIASRSRGTPRIANRLLRRVRDYAQIKSKGIIEAAVADAALTMLDVDKHGLDEMDRNLLATVISKFGGGPVGVDTIAAAISEEKATIEDILEPFLIQQGFLMRTARGRIVTPKSYTHLGLTSKDNKERVV